MEYLPLFSKHLSGTCNFYIFHPFRWFFSRRKILWRRFRELVDRHFLYPYYFRILIIYYSIETFLSIDNHYWSGLHYYS